MYYHDKVNNVATLLVDQIAILSLIESNDLMQGEVIESEKKIVDPEFTRFDVGEIIRSRNSIIDIQGFNINDTHQEKENSSDSNSDSEPDKNVSTAHKSKELIIDRDLPIEVTNDLIDTGIGLDTFENTATFNNLDFGAQ
jgi:hypothetical protein